MVLNDLANVNGSDYINASTIVSPLSLIWKEWCLVVLTLRSACSNQTDHDPRNPAYIATQGPLPNTAADFWQMVWEQGSVVIVNLTRLNENNTALCHRYWPEEGSELHHIYEVFFTHWKERESSMLNFHQTFPQVHLVSEHIWCDGKRKLLTTMLWFKLRFDEG